MKKCRYLRTRWKASILKWSRQRRTETTWMVICAVLDFRRESSIVDRVMTHCRRLPSKRENTCWPFLSSLRPPVNGFTCIWTTPNISCIMQGIMYQLPLTLCPLLFARSIVLMSNKRTSLLQLIVQVLTLLSWEIESSLLRSYDQSCDRLYFGLSINSRILTCLSLILKYTLNSTYL